MRYLLLFCTLWLFNAYSVEPKILKIGERLHSDIFFCKFVATVHDSSPMMLDQLDDWFRLTDMQVDKVYPDADAFKGKTLIDLAWAGALHFGAVKLFKRVLSRVPDISETKFGGENLLTAANMLMEARQLGLFSILPQDDAENMAKNAPRILKVIQQHPTWTHSLTIADRSLNVAALRRARTCYETLNISPSASAGDIRNAYKQAAAKWHPDKNLGNKEISEAGFKMIGDAYETLSDPVKREEYDRSLSS